MRTVALELEVGTPYVNKYVKVAPQLAFAGHKPSGLGVEFAIDGLKAYRDIKVLNVCH